MAHQKHAKLEKPIGGRWGRTEVAILGAPCSDIKELSGQIIKALSPTWKIAYVDAEHNTSANNDWSALNYGAASHLTDKINYFSVESSKIQSQFNNAADLVILNGNHFKAEKQIAWVHPKKSLENKLDKLSDVGLLIIDDTIDICPEFLTKHLKDQTYLTVRRSDTKTIINYLSKNLIDGTPPLNGLVLIGGNSSRMKQDKSRLVFHDGVAQVDFMHNLLIKYCDQVFISVRDGQQAESIARETIIDKFIGLGPYGGILSAFQYNPNTAWLVVAVDLPFVNENAIENLIEKRNIHKTATCFIDGNDKFPEPLITIWEPRAYPLLLDFLARGISCPRKALINSDVELITSRDPLMLTNVNTPEELESSLLKINN